MSTSTNAILAFGFDLGEELPESLVGEDGDSSGFDFDEWLNEKAGAVYPASHSGAESPEYLAYCKKVDDAASNCPVDLITHCSYEYSMYFLAVRGTEFTAYRGSPVVVSMPPVPPEKIEAMKAFCSENGVEWQEPQWHIFSLWGV